MREKINVHVIRLLPGDDVKKAIQEFVAISNIDAGWVISCAGSLTQYCIRFANRENGSTGTGFFEIISLSGTLSVAGSHLHIGIANNMGKMVGGHLLEGCIVYTTAEIVIGESLEFSFKREKDGITGWNELTVKSKSG